MSTNSSNSSISTSGPHVLPWATAGVWLTAAAGLVFWVLQWPSHDPQHPMGTPVSQHPSSSGPNAMVAKALGQPTERTETAEPPSSQLNLMGVMASPSGRGTALIAIDGQPPQAFQVGQVVIDTWTLDFVSARQVRLTSSGALRLLDMPDRDTP